MQVESLKQLFYDLLSDLYDAEKRITAALPKMERAATSPSTIDDRARAAL